MDQALLELGTTLTTLAVKGVASAVHTKIKTLQQEKDAETIRRAYDEIISELIEEREQAIRIAQAYKSELDRIVISDQDIKHLHNTIDSVLSILQEMNPNMPMRQFESLSKLISVDTLKAIQLLGFNYKAAIGEPLTQLCANAILSKGAIVRNQPRRK